VRFLYHLTVDPVLGTPLPVSSGQLQSLRVAITNWDISAIVVNDLGPRPSEAAAIFTATTGKEPKSSGGSWVWNLNRADRDGPFSAVNASQALRRCVDVSSDGVTGGSNSPPSPQVNACIFDYLAARGERLPAR
jgi:hypothetical protein